jgi:hypothetical protein
MQLSGIEKVKLAKELNGIRGTIQTVVNGLEKLKLAKRIGEIRVLLGGKKAEEFDPTTPEGYTKVKDDTELQFMWQDRLDSFFQSRIGAVREALRDLGWEGRNPKEARLYKAFNGNDAEAQFTFKNVGAGANVVGYSVNEMADDLTKTPEQFAFEIDAAVAAEIASRHPPVVNPAELPQGQATNEVDMTEDESYAREDELAIHQKAFDKFRADIKFQSQDDEEEWPADNESLIEFESTAFLVEKAVKEYGGTVVWGNFDASAYTGSVFDDARGGGNILEVVAYTNGKRSVSMPCAQFRKSVGAPDTMNMNDVIDRENKLRVDKGDRTVFVVEHTAAGQEPLFKLKKGIFDAAALDSVVSLGSIVGQIADKEGNVVARVRIEQNGVLTLFKGEQGLEQVASPTAAVAKINAVIDIVFGGVENKRADQPLPHEQHQMTDAEKEELNRSFRISEYDGAFKATADKIYRAIADIDWKSITNNATAEAASRALHQKVADRSLIEAARQKIDAAGIDIGTLNYDEMPGWRSYDEAVDAFRATGDKILDYGKKQLIAEGKMKLAALSPDATLEEKAEAVFASQGIENGSSNRVVEAIKNINADVLRGILGNLDNKGSRKLFEMATGITLAKTVKGTLPQIDEWAGISQDQRAAKDEQTRAERDANRTLSDLKYAWRGLEYEKVGTEHKPMQDWVKEKFAAGYKLIETRKKGVATTYWMANGQGNAAGFLRSKPFNTFLNAAMEFGGLKKTFAALDIDVEDALTPVERVDEAYQFNASPEFKEWIAESIDKTSYSPFVTAKAMDQEAKANGAAIEWGFFGGMSREDEAHLFGKTLDSAGNSYAREFYDEWEKQTLNLVDENDIGQVFEPDDESALVVFDSIDQEGYVGKIIKNGEVLGRIDIDSDGKAMVFVGPAGDQKARFKSQVDGEFREYMYSDDDAAEMVEALFKYPELNITGAAPEPAKSSTPATKEDATNAIKFLRDFIGRSQINAIATAMRGEEKQFFFDKAVELEKLIKSMPKSYETDGQGDKAVAYLHYFKGSGNWYITEKDAGDDEDAKNGISGQVQTFGMADLGHGGELGYISIKELIEANVEIDLYWTPKTLAVIKGKDDEPETKNEPVPVPADSDVADPSASGEAGQNADAGEANGQPAEKQGNPMKAAFEAELNALKLATDPDAFDKKLDEIAGRIEAAGLMSELDAELNAAADVLSDLLAKAEAA